MRPPVPPPPPPSGSRPRGRRPVVRQCRTRPSITFPVPEAPIRSSYDTEMSWIGPLDTESRKNPVLAAFHTGAASNAAPTLSELDIHPALDRHPKDSMLERLAEAIGRHYAVLKTANNVLGMIGTLETVAQAVQQRKKEHLQEKQRVAVSVFQIAYDMAVRASEDEVAGILAGNAAALWLRQRVPDQTQTQRAEQWLSRARTAFKNARKVAEKDKAFLAVVDGSIRLAKAERGNPTAHQLYTCMDLFESAYLRVKLTDPVMMATLLSRHAQAHLLLFRLLKNQDEIEAAAAIRHRLVPELRAVLDELDFSPSQLLTLFHEGPWVLGVAPSSFETPTLADIHDSVLSKLIAPMAELNNRMAVNKADFSGAQEASADTERILAEHQWLVEGSASAFGKYVHTFVTTTKSNEQTRSVFDEALQIVNQGYQRGLGPPAEICEVLLWIQHLPAHEHEVRQGRLHRNPRRYG